MKDFSIIVARMLLVVFTVFSISIVLPAIFAWNTVLMFPSMVLAVFVYAIVLYYQINWFNERT